MGTLNDPAPAQPQAASTEDKKSAPAPKPGAGKINPQSRREVSPPKIAVRGLNFYYGKYHALKDINVDIPEKHVTAFIGPSGCGKSTLLRT